MWLNYPLLPSPKYDREPTETYMLQTCEATISQFKGIADLACLMLVKIMKLIKVYIKAFSDAIKRTLHGQGSWKEEVVYAGTSRKLLHQLASWGSMQECRFLPSHYMVTWEEAFYTGFFEYQSSIFGPLVEEYGARFIDTKPWK